MSGPRKLYIKSYGCQMNVYDSHRMADTLAPQGFVECARPEDADLVASLGHAPDQVTTAVNGLFVPREERATEPQSGE